MTAESEYWSIDIPGLTRDEASELQEVVKNSGMGYFGSAHILDPKSTYVRAFDRATVQACIDLLNDDRLSSNDLAGLREDMEEWLEVSKG